jgi:hypothetical protein
VTASAPTWRKSGRSMANGNCVELAPAAVCNCGRNPACRMCGGTGTVWILPGMGGER